MQHIQPCVFCNGIVKVHENHWYCTQCDAEWTLGMRLIREGTHAGAVLDKIFGVAADTPETLCVDTIHQVSTIDGSICRCRIRIYRCEGVDVALLSELPDPKTSITNAIEEIVTSITTTYALDERAVFIVNDSQQKYVSISIGDDSTQWSRLVAEEVERLTGAFFCDSRIAEYSDLC